MISVRGVSKKFLGERRVDAVSELSFELEPGRFLAIVGRSGSGKSTLLGMTGGISRPTSGQVLVDGTDIWSLGADKRADLRNRKIGFVFQFAALLPSLRAIDNVALPALVGGAMEFREAYARARALLERVGLGERLESYPGQLSGGEQRRAAIARALINAPSVLLADEPTADLDEETEREILNLLIEIHHAFNLTLVVVTHNPEIAQRADQVLELRAGRVANCSARAVPVVSVSAVADAATAADSATVDAAPATSVDATIARCDQDRGIKSIFDPGTRAGAREKVRLGAGIERFVGRIVLVTIPIILLICGINAAIAMYEHDVIQAKNEAQQALEDLAMSGLRADVKNVVLGPKGSYILSIYLRNTTGEQPIYVMAPTVRGFVQVGSSWQEVPLKPMDDSARGVLTVVGEQVYKYVVVPNIADFAQLLPYYMHVRFTNDMLISPRSQPKDDLVERNDSYYVYLKPHNTSDSAILSKLKFPGLPPVWIPMPPH